jgi:hypothetical protein
MSAIAPQYQRLFSSVTLYIERHAIACHRVAHMQQWLLGGGEHHGGQGGIWDFFGRRNRVFDLRRYSHVAFDKEPLKADAGCRATH